MFELRNDSEVWYKSEDMYDWIQYGKLVIAERKPDMKNLFVIKKFNVETNAYTVCKDFITYKYNGKDYTVTDGCFEIEEEPEKEIVPTETEMIQAELLLNRQEIIIKQNEQDEVLAAILLGQQTF